MTTSRQKAIEMCVRKLGARTMGLDWYIDEHLTQALDVVSAGGSLFDLDNLVSLSELMGFDVTYDFFEVVDRYYGIENDTFSLFDIIYLPKKRNEIKQLLDKYMEGRI